MAHKHCITHSQNYQTQGKNSRTFCQIPVKVKLYQTVTLSDVTDWFPVFTSVYKWIRFISMQPYVNDVQKRELERVMCFNNFLENQNVNTVGYCLKAMLNMF